VEEAQQPSRWPAVASSAAAGTLVCVLGGYLLSSSLVDARGLTGTAVHITGIVALAAGLVLIIMGLLRATEKQGDKGLESRAERSGQPTEPEAYRDGGLAVVETAYSLEEANLIASVLRSEGLPAWVQGANIAAWYWHAQLGLQTGGIPVTVPTARLREAQFVLEAQHRNRLGGPGVRGEIEPWPGPGAAEADERRPAQEAALLDAEGSLATDPDFDEAVTAARLLRSSKVLLVLTSTVLPAPYLFYGAFQILKEIRRAGGRGSRCKELGWARGFALAAAVISAILTPISLILVVGSLVALISQLILGY